MITWMNTACGFFFLSRHRPRRLQLALKPVSLQFLYIVLGPPSVSIHARGILVIYYHPAAAAVGPALPPVRVLGIAPRAFIAGDLPPPATVSEGRDSDEL